MEMVPITFELFYASFVVKAAQTESTITSYPLNSHGTNSNRMSDCVVQVCKYQNGIFIQ